MDKSPAALVERFDTIAAERPDAERRLMFGYPCLFVGGNLATGLYEDRWHVRLSPADTTSLLALEGAGPFEPMPGRPMTGYTLLPTTVVDDDAAVRDWVGRAISHAASLPPKVPKPKKPKAAKPARTRQA
jgi:TfoX/Sxy family transcriptional regulator of competence genes